jgi:hypothetical protein
MVQHERATRMSRARYWFLLGGVGLGALALSGLQCAARSVSLPAERPRSVVTAPLAPKLFGRTIVIAGDASSAVRAAASVMQQKLGLATGASFAFKNDSAHGIFLLRSDSPLAPADLAQKLRGLGRESYAARNDNDGRLLIVANDDDGLVFGAYQALERWGVRFYFPSDAWTIVPSLSDIEQPLDVLVRPTFRVRGFFGTGGFGAKLAVDPTGRLAKRWEAWKTANGFGEEFHLGGHMGEAFNLRHKAELLAHPEYLASVDGKRGWSKGAKLDVSNAAAVELFVADRLDEMRAQRARDPNGARSFAVSVEPADGGLHCNSAECLRIGGPSEQQFFLANAVARSLAREFPGAHASLLAYNKHADVPALDLEPNVYVTIVPYAFRANSPQSPEAFIEAWSRKKTPLGLYDYWSIPDWSADLPEFDYRNKLPHRIRYWKEHRVEAAGAESTYSAGAMGLPLYIAGHLFWDELRSVDVLEEQFFRDCFAAAAPRMRRMLHRWAARFLLTSAELRASFEDLQQAFELASSGAVRRRLVDYAAYVQYLRLRYEFLNARADQQTSRKRDLLRHIWSVYDTGMLHSFRLHQLLVRGDSELAREFLPTDASLPIWSSLEMWSESSAQRAIADALHDLPASDLAVRDFTGELMPVPGAVMGPDPAASQLTLLGPQQLDVIVPSGVVQLEIGLRTNAPLDATVLDATGQALASTTLAAGDAKPLAMVVPSPGSYRVDLRAPKQAKLVLTLPAGVGVELQEFRIPSSSPVDLYFFVPKGARRVALHNRAKFQVRGTQPPTLSDDLGVFVTSSLTDGGQLLSAVVPVGRDGKVWCLHNAVAPLGAIRLLNAPQRFASSPAALRVPASALSAVTSAP